MALMASDVIAGNPEVTAASSNQRVDDSYEQAGYRKEGERVELYFCLIIDRITNVDVVNQTFSCSFDLELLWRATEDDDRRFKEDPFNYIPSFVPMVHYPNGHLNHEQIRKYHGRSYVIVKPGEANIRGQVFESDEMRCKYLNQCIFEIAGEFNEPFELKNFPLDVQDLQITLKLHQQSDVIILAPKCLNNSLSVVLSTEDWSVADYDIHPPILETWMHDYGKGLSHATLRMKFARKWQIYVWRIGFFSMILSMCCLFVFTLDHNDVSDRYDTLLTLLLAAVAFQYIVHEELPKLPYLTLMDIYELFCFSFVFLVLVLVTISGYFEVSETTDNDFCYAAIIVFVFFHIWFGCKAYSARKYEMRKLKMNRWDYEKYGYEQTMEKKFLLYPRQMNMDDAHKEKLLENSWWTTNEEWATSKSDQ